tara:strand:- start:60 stop:449 length:390 start_codon:yes stop_codon:yes gene_type:complete
MVTETTYEWEGTHLIELSFDDKIVKCNAELKHLNDGQDGMVRVGFALTTEEQEMKLGGEITDSIDTADFNDDYHVRNWLIARTFDVLTTQWSGEKFEGELEVAVPFWDGGVELEGKDTKVLYEPPTEEE